MDEIQRLQKNLALARGCAGWTAAVLAEKLGVKRQTVSTIEQVNGTYQMTRMQYLAVRKVFDDEIATSKDETRMLYFVLDALVDHPEKYTDAEKKLIYTEAKRLAPSIIKEPQTRKSATKVWKTILATSGIIVSATLLAFIRKNRKRGAL